MNTNQLPSLAQPCPACLGTKLLLNDPCHRHRKCPACGGTGRHKVDIGADTDRHSVLILKAGYHDATNNRWMPAKVIARLRAA